MGSKINIKNINTSGVMVKGNNINWNTITGKVKCNKCKRLIRVIDSNDHGVIEVKCSCSK